MGHTAWLPLTEAELVLPLGGLNLPTAEHC